MWRIGLGGCRTADVHIMSPLSFVFVFSCDIFILVAGGLLVCYGFHFELMPGLVHISFDPST